MAGRGGDGVGAEGDGAGVGFDPDAARGLESTRRDLRGLLHCGDEMPRLAWQDTGVGRRHRAWEGGPRPLPMSRRRRLQRLFTSQKTLVFTPMFEKVSHFCSLNVSL